MAKVKVLIEGYAKKTSDGWLASATTSLIEDGGKKILVDPGANRELLVEKLKQSGLGIQDIDLVFLTHYHPDHAILAGIFENKPILDGTTIYENDKETEYTREIPGTAVKVMATPGHADEQASLVTETDEGVVVVAADVFWWTEDEIQDTSDKDKLIEKEDPYVKDFEALKNSRKLVLEIADWIIPGHGKMFKVTKP